MNEAQPGHDGSGVASCSLHPVRGPDGQLNEEDDELPPLPWKKVTLAATLIDGANLERLDDDSHVQSTKDADTLDKYVSDHAKNMQQARRTHARLSCQEVGPWSKHPKTMPGWKRPRPSEDALRSP